MAPAEAWETFFFFPLSASSSTKLPVEIFSETMHSASRKKPAGAWESSESFLAALPIWHRRSWFRSAFQRRLFFFFLIVLCFAVFSWQAARRSYALSTQLNRRAASACEHLSRVSTVPLLSSPYDRIPAYFSSQTSLQCHQMSEGGVGGGCRSYTADGPHDGSGPQSRWDSR